MTSGDRFPPDPPWLEDYRGLTARQAVELAEQQGRPCRVIVAQVPGTGARRFVRNSPDGSARPTMPSGTIWKQPTSSDGP